MKRNHLSGLCRKTLRTLDEDIIDVEQWRLLRRLVYLDVSHVADLYEIAIGESPKTLVTKNQGGKAGAGIAFFTAEVSAQEVRSYTVSTFGMLSKLLPLLQSEPEIDPASLQEGCVSMYGWVSGELTVFKMRSISRSAETGVEKELAADELFQLRPRPGLDYALITTPEYFATGMSAFVKLQETLLKEMSVPVRAYMRVSSARGHTGQWIAMPLLILEAESSS